MIRYLLRLLGFPRMQTPVHKERPEQALSADLSENYKALKAALGESSDIIMRSFEFGRLRTVKALLVFVDGLVKAEVINDSIVRPLMYDSTLLSGPTVRSSQSLDSIKATMLSVGDVKDTSTLEGLLAGCLSGDTALLIDGFDKALIISSRGWDKRGVEEPRTESVVRGSREGFNESIRTNTALLRRKLKTPNLRIDAMRVGKRTHTDIAIAYIAGVADPSLVQTIKQRISAIDTDAILGSGYIEQYIEDAPFSIFSTIFSSEKPDVVAADMLEGRVAVLVDGTPFVLTAPRLFVESFQTAEDYYIRPIAATILRFLRFIAFTVSILAPGVYVALATFHQELIPTPLLFTMIGAREGVPYPALIEATIMVITFEILKEAGVRLPRPVGNAVSIVGALVMGEAAVSAGLIGAPIVIVIAIMAVAGFVVPTLEEANSVLRFTLLILGGTMGGFGIILGLLVVIIHLTSLESFGTPYLAPFAPIQMDVLRDTFIRMPLWVMRTRPEGMAKNNRTRQVSGVPPAEPPKTTDQ